MDVEDGCYLGGVCGIADDWLLGVPAGCLLGAVLDISKRLVTGRCNKFNDHFVEVVVRLLYERKMVCSLEIY